MLEWAARHLEDVGHSADHFTHGPGYVESAPCTMLHALDRALVAAKPYPSDGPEAWDAYREAAPTALRLVAEHVAGPSTPATTTTRRRSSVRSYSPGGTSRGSRRQGSSRRSVRPCGRRGRRRH
ncbi:DUF6197 family protein [Streptomyces nogalater]